MKLILLSGPLCAGKSYCLSKAGITTNIWNIDEFYKKSRISGKDGFFNWKRYSAKKQDISLDLHSFITEKRRPFVIVVSSGISPEINKYLKTICPLKDQVELLLDLPTPKELRNRVEAKGLGYATSLRTNQSMDNSYELQKCHLNRLTQAQCIDKLKELTL